MKAVGTFTTIGIAVLGCLLVGCSGTPIRLGSADQYSGPRDIDANTGRNIKASASGFQLLLLIPININDRQERAYQSLLAQAAGDYVTNIAVEESWTWAFVGTVYRTTLTATAYRRAAGWGRPAPQTGRVSGSTIAPTSLSEMCSTTNMVDRAECHGRIRSGMTIDHVTEELGKPSDISADGTVLRYDDRFIKFDSNNRLIGISERPPQ